MKAVLHLKFIVLYIIFGFLCVFTTATLTTELITERLEKDTSQTLYREATMIADNYLPSYFSNESSSWAVHSQLSAMKTYLNSSLWFVEKDGTMITSANLKDTTAPQSVNNFDPAEIGSNQYMIGTYHNYFQEDMITVMAPVTRGILYKGISDHSQPGLFDQRKMPHADGSGLYFSWSYFPVVLHLPARVPFLRPSTIVADHRSCEAICHGQSGLRDSG